MVKQMLVTGLLFVDSALCVATRAQAQLPDPAAGEELSALQITEFLARPGVVAFMPDSNWLDVPRAVLVRGEQLDGGTCHFRLKIVPPPRTPSVSLDVVHYQTADMAIDGATCEKVVQQGFAIPILPAPAVDQGGPGELSGFQDMPPNVGSSSQAITSPQASAIVSPLSFPSGNTNIGVTTWWTDGWNPIMRKFGAEIEVNRVDDVVSYNPYFCNSKQSSIHGYMGGTYKLSTFWIPTLGASSGHTTGYDCQCSCSLGVCTCDFGYTYDNGHEDFENRIFPGCDIGNHPAVHVAYARNEIRGFYPPDYYPSHYTIVDSYPYGQMFNCGNYLREYTDFYYPAKPPSSGPHF